MPNNQDYTDINKLRMRLSLAALATITVIGSAFPISNYFINDTVSQQGQSIERLEAELIETKQTLYESIQAHQSKVSNLNQQLTKSLNHIDKLIIDNSELMTHITRYQDNTGGLMQTVDQHNGLQEQVRTKNDQIAALTTKLAAKPKEVIQWKTKEVVKWKTKTEVKEVPVIEWKTKTVTNQVIKPVNVGSLTGGSTVATYLKGQWMLDRLFGDLVVTFQSQFERIYLYDDELRYYKKSDDAYPRCGLVFVDGKRIYSDYSKAMKAGKYLTCYPNSQDTANGYVPILITLDGFTNAHKQL